MNTPARQAAFTPGPWKFQGEKNGETFWIGPVGENVCCIPGYTDHPGNIANARLIASAPEMLDALKFALTIIGHPDDAGTQLIASIVAKAEGRS